MAAKELLKSIFATDKPGEAAQDKTGAREAQRPPAKERREGDYIPVIAVLVGLGLLGMAFLKPVQLQESPLRSQPEERGEEANFESDWPSTGPSY